nr:TVP38/TMEM64 family protein [Salinigranum halophilum]
MAFFVPSTTNPAWVRSQIETFGVFAPLVFVILQTMQVVIAPIPGQVLGGVGGYLFGTVQGTVYSLIGVVTGSAVVFVLSRRYGRPYVERVVNPEALSRWDDFVARNGVAGLFVLFLLPTFPDDVLCFIAGLSEIRLRTFLTLVVIGRAPSFFAVAYAGDRLVTDGVRAFTVILVLLGVFSLVIYRARGQLIARLDRLI